MAKNSFVKNRAIVRFFVAIMIAVWTVAICPGTVKAETKKYSYEIYKLSEFDLYGTDIVITPANRLAGASPKTGKYKASTFSNYNTFLIITDNPGSAGEFWIDMNPDDSTGAKIDRPKVISLNISGADTYVSTEELMNSFTRFATRPSVLKKYGVADIDHIPDRTPDGRYVYFQVVKVKPDMPVSGTGGVEASINGEVKLTIREGSDNHSEPTGDCWTVFLKSPYALYQNWIKSAISKYGSSSSTFYGKMSAIARGLKGEGTYDYAAQIGYTSPHWFSSTFSLRLFGKTTALSKYWDSAYHNPMHNIAAQMGERLYGQEEAYSLGYIKVSPKMQDQHYNSFDQYGHGYSMCPYTSTAPLISSKSYPQVSLGSFSKITKDKIDINHVSIKVPTIAGQKYTGSAIEPAVSITHHNRSLRSGTDYSVSYKNNINPGTATVEITGKGDYTGKRVLTFEIRHDTSGSDSDSGSGIAKPVQPAPQNTGTSSSAASKSGSVPGKSASQALKVYKKGLNQISGVWQYTDTKGKRIKYTGVVQNLYNKNWHYVKNGVYQAKFTGLARSVKNGKWYYVQKGKLNWNYTGLVKSGKKYYAVKKGKRVSFTGVVQNKRNKKWFYCRNGVYTKNYTGLAKSITNGRLYYVRKGQLNWKYNGRVKYQGRTYRVRNGRAR